MKFLLVFLLLPPCLLAQSGSLELLTGTWGNEHDTGGLTRVSLHQDGKRTLVHAWGSCVPIDCDWGETEVSLRNGLPAAVWKQGFATVQMQFVPLPDGRMIIATETEFNDSSGRKDPGHAEFFKRSESKPESDEALRARALLRQIAETYRNLPSAYFEAVLTSTRTEGKSEARTVTQEKISLAPPKKLRVEFERNGESYVLIDDGVSEWTVYPKTNEYRTSPQPEGPVPNGPLSGYLQLDNIRGDPKIAGNEEVQGADCIVVEIAMEHGVTERLWIDNSTHLVRKGIFDEGNSNEETVFTTERLGDTFPPVTSRTILPRQTQRIEPSWLGQRRKQRSGKLHRASAFATWTDTSLLYPRYMASRCCWIFGQLGADTAARLYLP